MLRRLFRLRPLDEERADATRLTGDKALAAGAVPLFYEPSLRLDVDDQLQTPYFFRFGDLRTAFEAQKAAGGAGASALNDPPMPRAVTLAGLVKGLETGAVPAETLLVAASEAAAVVAGMSGGAGPAGVPAGGASEKTTGASPGDAFFLTVPFANGRRV